MQVKFLQTSDPLVYRPLLAVSSIPVQHYCSQNGFEYQKELGIRRGLAPWHATFNRIPMFVEYLERHFCGWVCYVDADATVVDFSFDLPEFLSRYYSKLIVASAEDYNKINAGVIFINFSHPEIEKFVRTLSRWFSGIPDWAFRVADKPWGHRWTYRFNDQNLINAFLSSFDPKNQLVGVDQGVINQANGRFIRQFLRSTGLGLRGRFELLGDIAASCINRFLEDPRHELAKLSLLAGRLYPGVDILACSELAKNFNADIAMDGAKIIIRNRDEFVKEIGLDILEPNIVLERLSVDHFAADLMVANLSDDELSRLVEAYKVLLESNTLLDVRDKAFLSQDEWAQTRAVTQLVQHAVADSSYAHTVEAELLIEKGLYVEASEVILLGKDRNRTADILQLEALVNENTGKLALAIEIAQELIENNSEFELNFAQYEKILQFFSRIGDSKRAQELALKLVQRSPSDSRCWRILAILEYRLGNFDAASRAIDKALSYSPGNANMMYHKGRILMNKGNMDEAASSFLEAAKCTSMNSNSDLSFVMQLAGNLIACGDVQKAKDIGVLGVLKSTSRAFNLLPLTIGAMIKHHAGNDDLTFLANKYKSDKGTLSGACHGYTMVYDAFFQGMRDKSINLLELGLKIGGPELNGSVDRVVDYSPSVKMWLEYFPLGTVVGFDISDCSSICEERFHFVKGDQGSVKDLRRIIDLGLDFDIVIDDASHASYHQINTFSMLFSRVRSQGIYVIEDLHWQPQHYEKSLPKVPLVRDLFSYFVKHRKFPSVSPEFDGVLSKLSGEISHVVMVHDQFDSTKWKQVFCWRV